MKKLALSAAISAAVFASVANAAKVEVLDKTHSPAGQFLAYTEFELSGEPLAESLGLDLDTLDPGLANQPTAFDFAAGIESYEYSEEAMYALNYQSRMGPHLVNGPMNSARGGQMSDLGKRVIEMAKAVGFPANEIPLNMYPISMPYMSGTPEFSGKVDTSVVNGEEMEIVTATGEEKTVQSVIPAYFRDYKSLAWNDASFDKSFSPAATGGIMLKEVMWAQDFLGGMHVTESDEEVEAESMKMDQDGVHSLGVSAADGFNGMLLAEISLDKMLMLQNQLGFDGKKLGAKITPDYNPSKSPIWFAHKTTVKEATVNGVNAIDQLTVADSRSTLRDTWMLLWPVSEFYAFSDQRTANSAQNPAFKAVFDGAPFAAAPAANIDVKAGNNVVGNDMFSVTSNLSNLLFKNLSTLHFNSKAGTFVTDYSKGKQGSEVSTFDAAYSLVALNIFQRSQDALPVGYASAEGGDVNLKTPQGEQALKMVKQQADFIVSSLIGKNGLAYDSANLSSDNKNGNVSKSQSLETQFAVLRGLSSAFLTTGEQGYRTAARNLYISIEKNMFDKKLGTWATVPGKATIHTPFTSAAISGGLREAIQQLSNKEGENAPELELQALTNRYVSWFKTVINGGMQMAEWMGDSGENQLKDDKSTDTDMDGVHQIIGSGGKFGTAMVMAGKAKVSAK